MKMPVVNARHICVSKHFTFELHKNMAKNSAYRSCPKKLKKTFFLQTQKFKFTSNFQFK